MHINTYFPTPEIKELMRRNTRAVPSVMYFNEFSFFISFSYWKICKCYYVYDMDYLKSCDNTNTQYHYHFWMQYWVLILQAPDYQTNSAERQGFEPWVPKGYNGFRDRPDRPLRHLSWWLVALLLPFACLEAVPPVLRVQNYGIFLFYTNIIDIFSNFANNHRLIFV